MDQSAILASEAGKLTVTSCLSPSVRTVAPPWPIGPGRHRDTRLSPCRQSLAEVESCRGTQLHAQQSDLPRSCRHGSAVQDFAGILWHQGCAGLCVRLQHTRQRVQVSCSSAACRPRPARAEADTGQRHRAGVHQHARCSAVRCVVSHSSALLWTAFRLETAFANATSQLATDTVQ